MRNRSRRLRDIDCKYIAKILKKTYRAYCVKRAAAHFTHLQLPQLFIQTVTKLKPRHNN